MKFALKDGKYVNIKDVERGLKCGCICPVCGKPLIARKGDILSHTFAHTSDSKCCLHTNSESALHWNIKENFINYIGKELTLSRGDFETVVSKKLGYSSLWLVEKLQDRGLKPLVVRVNNVLLEKSYGSIRPDVVLQTDKGDILIEIAVHHYMGKEKKEKLKELGLPCVEIGITTNDDILDSYIKEDGSFYIEEYMKHRPTDITWYNDSFTDDMLEYISSTFNIKKGYFTRAKTGRIVKQIYDPPCSQYKTLYSLKCRGCKDNLFIGNDYEGCLSDVACGKFRNFNIDGFIETYLK